MNDYAYVVFEEHDSNPMECDVVSVWTTREAAERSLLENNWYSWFDGSWHNDVDDYLTRWVLRRELSV